MSKIMLAPVAKALTPIANISIESQVLVVQILIFATETFLYSCCCLFISFVGLHRVFLANSLLCIGRSYTILQSLLILTGMRSMVATSLV